MATWMMTKEARIYNGEEVSGAGKNGELHGKEWN